jgi:hypothetical protein
MFFLSSPKLVLKRFTLGQTTPEGAFLAFQGRAPGLISFLLNLAGLDPTTTMLCFLDRLELSQSGLFGRTSVVIPLKKVTAVQGGYSKPLYALVAALFAGLYGLSMMMVAVVSGGDTPPLVFGMLAFLVAAIFLAVYVLSRKMTLHVQNGGDRTYGVTFGQGVIEGVAVDAARVQQAVEMLQRAVLAAR